MIQQTTSHFVRCMKPNSEKRPGKFNGRFIERQLRYTGVSAVTQMYRVGYPSSLRKKEFAARYRGLAFAHDREALQLKELDEMCIRLCNIAQAKQVK